MCYHFALHIGPDLSSGLLLFSDNLSNFAVPERIVYSASGYMPQGWTDTTSAVQRLSASESPGSALRLHPLAPDVTDGVIDEARYIPLHQSSAVMTFLHDKIDEQAKVCLLFV